MEEQLFDLKLKNPESKLEEAMIQMGYKYRGFFKYDYPDSAHKWYERIKTELYEKNNQLYYFASVTEWKDDKIAVLKIGNIENKNSKNPECIFI